MTRPATNPRDQRLREARVPAVLTAVVGAWVIAAPYVLDYARTLAGVAGYWNDTVTGVVVVVVALCCLVVPRLGGSLGIVNVVLGFWLIVSPFAFGYPAEGHRDLARFNDILCGILVAVFAVVVVIVAVRRRRALRG